MLALNVNVRAFSLFVQSLRSYNLFFISGGGLEVAGKYQHRFRKVGKEERVPLTIGWAGENWLGAPALCAHSGLMTSALPSADRGMYCCLA